MPRSPVEMPASIQADRIVSTTEAEHGPYGAHPAKLALSTGNVQADLMQISMISADLMVQAVIRGIMKADGFSIVKDWNSMNR